MIGTDTFTTYDRPLPGVYRRINIAAATSGDTERGIVAVITGLGCSDVPTIQMDRRAFLAGDYTAQIGLSDTTIFSEIFRRAAQVIVINSTAGTGTAATAASGGIVAQHTGAAGNSIQVAITANVDDSTKHDIVVRYNDKTVERFYKIAGATYGALEIDSEFVKMVGDGEVTVGTYTLTGGANAEKAALADILAEAKNYAYNILYIPDYDTTENAPVIAQWAKEQRTAGARFQVILTTLTVTPDTPAVIWLADAPTLAPWLAGAEAACEIGLSLTNAQYDGDLDTSAIQAPTQDALIAARKAGKLMMHKVGDAWRVLDDVNSLIDAEEEELLQENSTIRTLDILAERDQALFVDSYLGQVINNEEGRNDLRLGLTAIREDLASAGVLAYDENDLTVEAGPEIGQVIYTETLTLYGTMRQLYITTTIQ